MSDKKKLPPGALSLSNTPEQNKAAFEELKRKDVQTILRGAEKDPSYLALQTYLQSRNAVPEVRIGYAGGNLAQFATGGGLPRNGVVELSYETARDPNFATNSLVHETTHAADKAMDSQFHQRMKDMGASYRNIPEGVNQFVDAYRKMSIDPTNLKANPRQDLAARFYPEWLKEEGKYRASRVELPAWGTGNFTGGSAERTAPPHVDASAATDFMVLLDLAQRDAAKAQGPAPGIVDYFRSLFK